MKSLIITSNCESKASALISKIIRYAHSILLIAFGNAHRKSNSNVPGLTFFDRSVFAPCGFNFDFCTLLLSVSNNVRLIFVINSFDYVKGL